jgi:tight adherence protein B
MLAAIAGLLAGPALFVAAEALTVSIPRLIGPLARRGSELAGRVLGPLQLAGAEGIVPTDTERLRLCIAAAGLGLMLGFAAAGTVGALVSSIASGWLASRALVWRREHYRRRLDAGAASAALALADALSAGHSIRAALAAGGQGLAGPIGVELRRVGRELDLGGETDEALERFRHRARSRRLNLIVAAVRIQRRAGGSLATLLREIAATISEHDRLEDEARSASAQARFTSVVVLCLPLFGLLGGELASPGIVGRIAGSVAGAWLLGGALLLQLAGIFLIRRLSRVDA